MTIMLPLCSRSTCKFTPIDWLSILLFCWFCPPGKFSSYSQFSRIFMLFIPYTSMIQEHRISRRIIARKIFVYYLMLFLHRHLPPSSWPYATNDLKEIVCQFVWKVIVHRSFLWFPATWSTSLLNSPTKTTFPQLTFFKWLSIEFESQLLI